MRPPLLAVALAAALAPGCGIQGARLAVVEDNDVFNLGKGLDDDRDYTQGASAALTLSDADTPAWAKDFASAIPLYADDSRVHLAFTLGQEVYTPEDLLDPALIPDDRPYAGWLWAGMAIQGRSLDDDPDRRRDRMDLLEFDLGVVGPASQGERVQNTWHREVLGIDEAQGWDNQIGNELGALLTWERRMRLVAGGVPDRMMWDAIPRLRARAGNIRVDATLGLDARVGWNLPRDFGPMAVDGTGLQEGTDPPEPWLALSGGAAIRAVAHDITLDGNTWKDSHSVDRMPFVPESSAAVTVGWGPFSASFAQMWNRQEFDERTRNHRWSRFLFSWAWYF
jgi:hypothetical protein